MRKPDALSDSDVQAESRRWWETNPMSYDWHKTIAAAEGTPEFFCEIDRRFFNSSSFYRPVSKRGRIFERWIPFEGLRGKRVLEIGCGLGSHAQLLAQAGCSLTCIDLSGRAVENTRRRLELRGLSADVLRMDAEQMNFRDEEFDFVWSWGVIHHSADPNRIFRQVHRVLKSGGEFRFMVYHRRSLSALYCLVRGLLSGKFREGRSAREVLSFYTDGHLSRFYSPAEIRVLLLGNGFPRIETRVLGQKSEILPLPGSGALGALKRVLLHMIPDSVAESALSMGGYFLFAVAHKDASSS